MPSWDEVLAGTAGATAGAPSASLIQRQGVLAPTAVASFSGPTAGDVMAQAEQRAATIQQARPVSHSFLGTLGRNLASAGSMLKGIVTGIPKLGENIVGEVYGDIAHPSRFADFLHNYGTSKADWESPEYKRFAQLHPLFAQEAESLHRTKDVLIHPGELGQRWSEGTLLPTLAETAANVAMVGRAGAHLGSAPSRLALGQAEGLGQQAAAAATEGAVSAPLLAARAERRAQLAGTLGKPTQLLETALRGYPNAIQVGGRSYGAPGLEAMAGLPFRPFLAVGRGGGKVLGKIPGVASLEENLAGRMAEGRLRRQGRRVAIESDLAVKQAEKPAALAFNRAIKILPAAEDQQAALLIHSAADPNVLPLADMPAAATAAERQMAMDNVLSAEQNVTPATMATIKGYVDGTLDAGKRAAIDQFYETISAPTRALEARRLEGGPAMVTSLNPEQLANAPMPSKIAVVTTPLTERIAALTEELQGRKGQTGLEAKVARLRAGVDAEATRIAEAKLGRRQKMLASANGKLAELMTRLQEGPSEVAPASHLPALLKGERGQATAEALAAGRHGLATQARTKAEALAASSADAIDMQAQVHALLEESMGHEVAAAAFEEWGRSFATTMRQLETATTITPEYMPGAKPHPVSGGGFTGPAQGGPAVRKGRWAHAKTEGATPSSARDLARVQLQDIARIARNETALKVTFAETAQAMIDKRLDTLRTSAALAQGAEKVPIIEEIQQLQDRLTRGGNDLAAEMDRRGYASWDPRRAGARVPETQVAGSTMFLPKAFVKGFEAWNARSPLNDMASIRAYDFATRMWKHTVLALNPMWNVGNAITNAIAPMLAGGVSPLEEMRTGLSAFRQLREETRTGQPIFSAELHGRGASAEHSAAISPLRRPEKENVAQRQLAKAPLVGDVLAHPVQASYNLNEFVDNWARATQYLVSRDRYLRAGVALERADQLGIRDALKVLGDFSKMSPFERDYVKRVIPFWAWTRHLIDLTGHMALEHPLRTAIVLHMANLSRTPEDIQNLLGMPDWMRSYIPVGKGYFNVAKFVPFGGGIDMLTKPGRWLASANPVLQAGASGLLNFNMRAGRFNTQQPAPGQSSAGKMEMNLSGLPYYLTQTSPIPRALFDMFGKPVKRYDSGQAILKRGKPLPVLGSTRDRVLNDLGLPVALPKDILGALKTEQAKEAKARAAERRKVRG